MRSIQNILCMSFSVYEPYNPTSLFPPKVNHIFCWLETQVRGNLSFSSMQWRLYHGLCLLQELDLRVQVGASLFFWLECVYIEAFYIYERMCSGGMSTAEAKNCCGGIWGLTWLCRRAGLPFCGISVAVWWAANRESYKLHPEAPLAALPAEDDLDLYF